MAHVLYRRFESLRSVNFGHGRLLLVAWRKSEGGLAVPMIMLDPPEHGAVPRWPFVVAGFPSWKETKEAFRKLEELPEFTQLVVCWRLDPEPLAIIEIADLDELITEARAEAINRWGTEVRPSESE